MYPNELYVKQQELLDELMKDLSLRKKAEVIVPMIQPEPEVNNIYKFAPENNINIFLPKEQPEDYEEHSKTKSRSQTIASGRYKKNQRFNQSRGGKAAMRSSQFVESTFTDSRASLIKAQTIGNRHDHTRKSSDYDLKAAKNSIHANL